MTNEALSRSDLTFVGIRLLGIGILVVGLGELIGTLVMMANFSTSQGAGVLGGPLVGVGTKCLLGSGLALGAPLLVEWFERKDASLQERMAAHRSAQPEVDGAE